jgi:two-component system chemotaxis response regulator CheY
MKLCLIVDDSAVIRKVAKHFIENMDYDIIEVDKAEDALDQCKLEMPDVIVLDWHLPSMSALDFLEALKGLRTNKRPFVLYCPTEYDTAMIGRALSAGANDFIMKPFDGDTLVAKFNEIANAA